MDLITVDVGDIPGVVEGDWAELFGPSMPVDEAAKAANTVGYEFLTQLSRRAERIYVDAPGPPDGARGPHPIRLRQLRRRVLQVAGALRILRRVEHHGRGGAGDRARGAPHRSRQAGRADPALRRDA